MCDSQSREHIPNHLLAKDGRVTSSQNRTADFKELSILLGRAARMGFLGLYFVSYARVHEFQSRRPYCVFSPG